MERGLIFFVDLGSKQKPEEGASCHFFFSLSLSEREIVWRLLFTFGGRERNPPRDLLVFFPFLNLDLPGCPSLPRVSTTAALLLFPSPLLFSRDSPRTKKLTKKITLNSRKEKKAFLSSTPVRKKNLAKDGRRPGPGRRPRDEHPPRRRRGCQRPRRVVHAGEESEFQIFFSVFQGGRGRERERKREKEREREREEEEEWKYLSHLDTPPTFSFSLSFFLSY